MRKRVYFVAATIVVCLMLVGHFVLAQPKEERTRAMRFEYRTCFIQDARVSFVNGAWQGRVRPAKDNADEALKSCPQEWDYLNNAGNEGWELVAVVGAVSGESTARQLYLKRVPQ
jgi:hypothetical protein